jgi:hypothetical protein
MRPEDFSEIALGMSNFDHTIDNGFEDAIRNNRVFGRHAGWNFNGETYYLDGKFHTDVWVYGEYRKTITADNLPDLMGDANDEYGWD